MAYRPTTIPRPITKPPYDPLQQGQPSMLPATSGPVQRLPGAPPPPSGAPTGFPALAVQNAPPEVSTPGPSTPPPALTPSAAPPPAGSPAPGPATTSIHQGTPDQKLAFIQAHPEWFDTSIPPAQWQAWLGDLQAGCPDSHPFKSRPDPNGRTECASKPDDCPEGFRVLGNDRSGTARCLPAGSFTDGGPGGGGIGGGGGGGIGGAGGAGGAGGPGSGLYDQQNDFLWQALLKRLEGGSRFTPDVMSSLQGDIKRSSELQSRTAQEQSNADLASRGLARSGIAADQAREIRQGASGQVLQARSALLKAKVDADYQDQSDTLNQMQNWLNSARQSVLQSRATEYQKQIAMAQIELGYAQLQQQFDILREQYAQQLATMGLGL